MTNFTSSVSVEPALGSIQTINVSADKTFTSSSVPLIHIPPPTSGTQAKAHVNLDGHGNIDSVTIDTAGSGYDSQNPPTPTIIDGYTPSVNLSIEQSISKIHSSEIHTQDLYISGTLVNPNLSSSIMNIQGDIMSLEGRVSDLESVDNTTDERLDDHEARLGVAEGDIDSLQTSKADTTYVDSTKNDLASKSQKVVIMSPEPSVYADGAQPSIIPSNLRASVSSGWYFKNTGSGNKINWYLPSNSLKVGDVYGFKLGLHLVNKTSPPFFTIYTKPKASGNQASWYHSRATYILEDPSLLSHNTPYTLGMSFHSQASVSPMFNSTYKPMAFDSFSSKGTMSPTDDILFFSFGSNSSSSAGNVEFILHTIELQSSVETTCFKFNSLISSYLDSRITAIENVDTNDDSRLDALEASDTQQNSRLDGHDEYLDNLNNSVNDHMNRIGDLEASSEDYSARITDLENHDVAKTSAIEELQSNVGDHENRIGSLEDKTQDFEITGFEIKPVAEHNCLYISNKDVDNKSTYSVFSHNNITTSQKLKCSDVNGNWKHSFTTDIGGKFSFDFEGNGEEYPQRSILEIDSQNPSPLICKTDFQVDGNFTSSLTDDHESRIVATESITQQFSILNVDWLESKKSLYLQEAEANYIGFIHYITEADSQRSEIDLQFSIWKDGKHGIFDLYKDVKGSIAQDWVDNFSWWFKDGKVETLEGLEVSTSCLVKCDLEVQQTIYGVNEILSGDLASDTAHITNNCQVGSLTCGDADFQGDNFIVGEATSSVFNGDVLFNGTTHFSSTFSINNQHPFKAIHNEQFTFNNIVSTGYIQTFTLSKEYNIDSNHPPCALGLNGDYSMNSGFWVLSAVPLYNGATPTNKINQVACLCYGSNTNQAKITTSICFNIPQ